MRTYLQDFLSKLTKIHPHWKYYLLGCLQNLAMLQAQIDKAYISFLMPDILFSDHAITNFFTAIQDGKKAAVATAFRTLDKKVAEHIKPYFNDNALEIPAAMVANIAANCMHKAAQFRIVASQNPNSQMTAQMIFHYPGEI